jgi:hypothetical protein
MLVIIVIIGKGVLKMADEPKKENDQKEEEQWPRERQKNLLEGLEKFLAAQNQGKEGTGETTVPVPPEPKKPDEKEKQQKQSKGFLDWLW